MCELIQRSCSHLQGVQCVLIATKWLFGCHRIIFITSHKWKYMLVYWACPQILLILSLMHCQSFVLFTWSEQVASVIGGEL